MSKPERAKISSQLRTTRFCCGFAHFHLFKQVLPYELRGDPLPIPCGGQIEIERAFF